MVQGRLVALVGPTAVGKTELSLRLGQAFDGEIVSADSRQVYRYLDIGTAKPSQADLARVRHHCIDIVDPDETLSLAQYRRLAQGAIAQIWDGGRLPLVVGGTGLYVRALLEGWSVPEVPPDQALREALREHAHLYGHVALHSRLAAIDPEAASGIDSRNVRRVIRALEVYHSTGKPISSLQAKCPPDWAVLRIGLTRPRALLYGRIDARVDEMIRRGLLAEVRCLLDRGYGLSLPSMSALGYREIGQHLSGEISLDEAAMLVKRRTRRFVRQQYNWFRLSDASIHWFDMTNLDDDAVCALVRSHLTA